VEPKPPQADFKKLFKYDGCILRFGAKLISAIRDNGERDFVISYFLADDTVQIYESSRRNSGFLGGEFLKKARVPLPGQDMFSSSRPEYYRANDFYIGRTMTLKDHIFHIVSADEFTLMYMEQHPSEVNISLGNHFFLGFGLRLIELVVEIHQPDQLTPDLFLHKRHRKCTTRNKL